MVRPQKPSPKIYPRGSAWRRWDLHVHTPASALENNFGSWDEYVNALETAGLGVAVLGVTDYCTIEGYKELLAYAKKGRLASFDLILPNIEFRTHPELPDGSAINFHLIISPDDPEHVIKIERALQQLTFTYDKIPYACTKDGLTAFGKALDPKQTNDDAAFRGGVNAFKPSFETFRKWFNDQGWLQRNALVVISNGKDGASGLSKDAGFRASRDELYRFSNMVFSGNPKDRAYFLGDGTDSKEEVERKAGSLKPCIHGSDAHADGKLFSPDRKRFCWIKADPSYEGLKQIVHEPRDRVYIGPSSPESIDSSKVIDSVTIGGASHWFTTPSLLLSPGLVAIIGEKGSGKTALGDLIAYACGAWNGKESSSSFIRKASPHLDGVSVTVSWADGHTSSANIDEGPSDTLPEVRYLSQDFVEELCSEDVAGNRLIQEIEQVVFSYINEPDRLGASSFPELRRLKTERLIARRAAVRARLSQLNTEIVALEDEVDSRAAKLQHVQKLDEDIAAIDKQLPSLQGTVDKQVAEALSKEKEALQRASRELTIANRKLNDVTGVRGQLSDFRVMVEEQFSAIRNSLTSLGLTEEEIAAFAPTFTPNADAPLTLIETELKASATKLRGDPDNPTATGVSIPDIEMRIKDLEKRLAVDEQQRSRLLALQKQRSTMDGERERLRQEMKKIDMVTTKMLTNKQEDRWKTYLSSFDLLKEEDQALKDLYAPLRDVIAADKTGAKTGFALEVRQLAAGNSWLETGSNLVDKRRKDVPIDDRAFVKRLEKELIVPWQTGDKVAIRAGLQGVLKDLGETPQALNSILLSHTTRTQLYDWLFSPEHVRLEYGLTYQGTDLDALSPGTRGIVLLVLYLAMDQHDRRPLIIDQPEGNLDNSSVYEALVPFLREAKKSRQIILVTHNPNLVVTADAEQVIVATAAKQTHAVHPLLTYVSGSLENSGDTTAIRERVVRLLEGGKDPFMVRESRYDLK